MVKIKQNIDTSQYQEQNNSIPVNPKKSLDKVIVIGGFIHYIVYRGDKISRKSRRIHNLDYPCYKDLPGYALKSIKKMRIGNWRTIPRKGSKEDLQRIKERDEMSETIQNLFANGIERMSAIKKHSDLDCHKKVR